MKIFKVLAVSAALTMVLPATTTFAQSQGVSQDLFERSMICIGKIKGSVELAGALFDRQPDNQSLAATVESGERLMVSVDSIESNLFSRDRGLNVARGKDLAEANRAAYAYNENKTFSENFDYFSEYGGISDACMTDLIELEGLVSR